MSAKPSKEDMDRGKSGRFLLAALKRQGVLVASILTDLATPHLREDDPEPGFLGTIIALARRLEAAIARLMSADQALYDANAQLTALRKLRDALTAKLAGEIVRLRRTVLGHFVSPSLVALALHSPRAYRADPDGPSSRRTRRSCRRSRPRRMRTFSRKVPRCDLEDLIFAVWFSSFAYLIKSLGITAFSTRQHDLGSVSSLEARHRFGQKDSEVRPSWRRTSYQALQRRVIMFGMRPKRQ